MTEERYMPICTRARLGLGPAPAPTRYMCMMKLVDIMHLVFLLTLVLHPTLALWYIETATRLEI